MANKHIAIPKGTRIPHYWSVSRYNTWRQCARRYMLQYILKLPMPDFPAMERGIRIHKLMEEYLKGNIKGMPDELSKLKKEIINLKKLKVDPETSWTLTKDFQQTHPKDWDNAWLRAKIDAHHYFEDEKEILIIDLKTGRVKLTLAQMDLYAWMSRYFYPEAENIVVELWFSDHGEIEPKEYTPRRANGIGKKWVKRSDAMLKDRKFLPSPSSDCNRCPFRSSYKMPNEEFGPCHAWKTIT